MSDLSVWTDDEQPAGRHNRSRRRRHRDRRSGVAVAVAVALVLVLIGGGAGLLLGLGATVRDVFRSTPAGDYPGPGTGSVQVQVTGGQSVAEIARTLKAKGVVQTVDGFLRVANAEPKSSSIQPGFYDMRHRMRSSDALATLLDPSARIQARVTLPEGLRLDETLRKVSREAELPLRTFEQSLKHARSLGLPGYAKGNAEGFLFPATYDVAPDATAASVIEQMFASYRTAAEEAGVTRTNRMPYEIVVIASLVEAEARHASDYGKVARVVYNRLRQHRALQLDSTVNYAIKADKQIVTHQDLGVDSPYNTYQHTGLPPGPINSPGLAALKAAVNPTPGNWVYFVTTNPRTGETKFTSSYRRFVQLKKELKSHQ